GEILIEAKSVGTTSGPGTQHQLRRYRSCDGSPGNLPNTRGKTTRAEIKVMTENLYHSSVGNIVLDDGWCSRAKVISATACPSTPIVSPSICSSGTDIVSEVLIRCYTANNKAIAGTDRSHGPGCIPSYPCRATDLVSRERQERAIGRSTQRAFRPGHST